MHLAEVGDKVVVVVAGENQFASMIALTVSINQLSGMGSSVGRTKECLDVVGVGLPLKNVWIMCWHW